MKRKALLACGLALCLACAALPPCLAAEEEPVEVSDVSPSDWSYDAVRFVVDTGRMKVYGSTVFQPKREMTREEIADAIYQDGQLRGITIPPGGSNVKHAYDYDKIDLKYRAGVEYCYYLDIMTGSQAMLSEEEQKEIKKAKKELKKRQRQAEKNGDTINDTSIASINEEEFQTFLRPKDTITRAEFARVLWEYYKRIGGKYNDLVTGDSEEALNGIKQMADADDLTGWKCEPVGSCLFYGVLHGDEQGRFNSYGAVTRAQMAQILYNFSEVIPVPARKNP